MAPLASNTTDNATEVAAAPSSSLTASFFLFLGDFIYADLPSRIRDDVQEYRRLYRRNYVSKSFRKVFEKLRESSASYISGTQSHPSA
jgi:alkaline phosphatase D